MKKAIYSICAVFMATLAASVLYYFGLRTWTVILALVLFACPLLAIVVALRESRHAKREVDTAVAAELRRRST